jgi:hypothetical protein
MEHIENPKSICPTVEAQFMVRAITDPVDHYYVVMAALPKQLSELVSYILDKELIIES